MGVTASIAEHRVFLNIWFFIIVMNDDINKSIFQLIILFAKHFYNTVNIFTKIIYFTALGSHSDSTTDPRGDGGRDSGALGFRNLAYDFWGVGRDVWRQLCRHMRGQISACVDGGLSAGSSVRRPGSEDTHQRQRFLFLYRVLGVKFYYIFILVLYI